MDNAEIARESLKYFRERDKAQEPRQAKMDELTNKMVDQQMNTSSFNDKMARDQWDRYRTQGIPAEDAMYADAAGYDSKQQLDKAAGEAATDVDVAMSQAGEAQRRNMARMGVNPADGRALAMAEETAATGALGKASAMNGARNQRRQMGIMLRKDAAGFGRGATGTAAQTFGVASAAGGQASGMAGAAIGAANQTAQTMGTGFGLGIQGNNSSGSILNQEYATGVKAAGDSNSGMASLAGTAATIGIAI